MTAAPMRQFLLLFVFVCLFLSEVTLGQAVKLKDRTDWWSINNERSSRATPKISNENIAVGTFQIAGVTLGRDQFKKFAANMGEAPTVERGDASTGRQQVCYVAAGAATKPYLIFEFGEDETNFYLFADGAEWTGQKLCTKTNHVSFNLATASGLKLGLTPAQVEAILGKPDGTFENRLIYVREIMQKTTPAEFEELRRNYPDHLSDRLAHENFDSYSVEVYIEARFGKTGMNYLAVSKSGGVE